MMERKEDGDSGLEEREISNSEQDSTYNRDRINNQTHDNLDFEEVPYHEYLNQIQEMQGRETQNEQIADQEDRDNHGRIIKNLVDKLLGRNENELGAASLKTEARILLGRLDRLTSQLTIEGTPSDWQTSDDYYRLSNHSGNCFYMYQIILLAVDNGDKDAALEALNEARSELIRLEFEVSQRDKTRAQATIESEASKLISRATTELTGWQKAFVLNLLTDDGIYPKNNLVIDTVIKSKEIIDQRALERSKMYDTLERQFSIFEQGARIAVLSILALFLFSPYVFSVADWLSVQLSLDILPTPAFQTREIFGEMSLANGSIFYISILLFGLLGASISGLFSLRGMAFDDQGLIRTVDLGRLALARLTLGVSSALFLVAFLESGFLDEIFVMPVTLPNPTMALVVAFVAGFSERLLLVTVARSIGAQEDDITSRPPIIRPKDQESNAESHRNGHDTPHKTKSAS